MPRKKTAEFAVVLPGVGSEAGLRIREVALDGPKWKTATPSAKMGIFCRFMDCRKLEIIEEDSRKGVVGCVYPSVGELGRISQIG